MSENTTTSAIDGALSYTARKTRERWISDQAADLLFRAVAGTAGYFVLILLTGAALSMAWGGRQAFHTFGWQFLTSTDWDPVTKKFGAFVPIYGTIVSSTIAIVIAVPTSLGISIFLTEIAPKWMRGPVGTAIELLAAIPSIIYGMWGLFVFVPFMANYVQPWMIEHLGSLPVIGALFQGAPIGIGMLTGGIILGIMIVPFITSVMREVFMVTPAVLKESAFALGATRWEVVRKVVIPYTRSAVVGAIFLGLGRALGETMAVTFVLGNAHDVNLSLMMPGNSIAAALANEFTEADSDIYLSALIALGFLLFVVTFITLAIAKLFLLRVGRSKARPREKRAMNSSLYFRRRLVNRIVLVASTAATAFGLFWLVWIMLTTLTNGLGALSLKLFTEMTPPPGESGGLLNAFYGSFVMVMIAVVVGTPIGVMAGTFLAEFHRSSKVGAMIRFVNDILLSAPSIVVGLFVYELMIRQQGHFSGWAGGLALSMILLPVVVRTTDEMLQLVPQSMREAGLSLGIPKWKTVSRVLYRAASAGILTGVLLAVARISGETAPLLFTALNNQYWTSTPAGPMANIPVVIFQYALSPYDAWHSLAWAGAFVVTLFILILAVFSRAIINRGRASR